MALYRTQRLAHFKAFVISKIFSLALPKSMRVFSAANRGTETPAKPVLRPRFTTTVRALSTSRMGLPVRGPGSTSRGVHDIVGPHHQCHIGLGEGGADLIERLHPLIGDVGLGQKDVHVARHPASHRMDPEFHLQGQEKKGTDRCPSDPLTGP